MTDAPIQELKRLWQFLQEDSWQSWLVSLILIVAFIKLIFFPGLSWITSTPLPLVVVESCSMYHPTINTENWWSSNGLWYEKNNITKKNFFDFPFRNGLNKGDIIFVIGKKEYKKGDIIIFEPNTGSTTKHPIIHRIISEEPTSTKGDNNAFQFDIGNNPENLTEISIEKSQILGKSLIKIPLIGWLKLIFFEPSKHSYQRGLCS